MTQTVVLREGKRATFGGVVFEVEQARGGEVKLRLGVPKRHRRVRIIRPRHKRPIDSCVAGD